MMPDESLRNLYQQVILDHAHERHGHGIRPGSAASAHELNPTCGDEITLHVYGDESGSIASIAWEGNGCSISQASASMLSDLMVDLRPNEVDARIDTFRALMQSKGTMDAEDDALGDLLEDAVSLAGVSKYVTRIKCAMLPWVALEHARAQLVP
jgi:nitrogen fixation NifU-like protein